MELFMNLIGLVMIVYMGYLAIDKLPALKDLFQSDSQMADFFNLKLFKKIVTNKEIKNAFSLPFVLFFYINWEYLFPYPELD